MLFLYEGKLNDLDMVIAKAIDANPEIILNNNIFEAAEIIGISASKLTKFCQKINLSGFKEIKYRLEQEIQNDNYMVQSGNEIDLKEVINNQYHHRLIDIPPLINNCTKILVVTNIKKSTLANHIAYELRTALETNVVSYTTNHDFSFEYKDENVLTVFIDKCNEIDVFSCKWYRRGYNYIHLAEKQLPPHENYYPVYVGETELNYPFDIKVLMILSWIKKVKS